MQALLEYKEIILKIAGYTFAGIFFFFNKEIKQAITIKLSLKKKNFYNGIDYENEINLLLQHLLSKFGFNRIAIIRFHNGLESYNGISFRLAKMMYEKTDHKTKSLLTTFKDVPTSFLTDSLLKLKNSTTGYCIQEDAESLIESFQVKRNIDFMLSPNLMDGILRCSYYDKPKELSSADIKEIRTIIDNITLLEKKMNK